MSDLELLRTKIEREMAHAPNVRSHRDDLNDRLNAAQLHIGTMEKWAWLDRLSLLRCLPPLTLTDADYTLAPGGAGVASDAAFSFLRPDGYEFNDVLLLAGHTVTINDVEYIIERAFGTSFLGTDTFYVFLDPRFSVAALAPTGDFTFTLDRYVMPRDIAELFTIMSRSDDQGPLQEIALKTEEWLYLNRDEPDAEPVAIMSSPNLASAHSEPWVDAGPNNFVAAPETAPTATSAAAGSLNGGQEYEYFYVWVVAGMMSARSPVAKVTTQAGHGTVNLTNLEVAYRSGSTDPLGRERWVFRRTDEGPWRLIRKLDTNSGLDNLSDTGGQVFGEVDAYPRARRFLNEGFERHMRVWPPPATRKDLELRYLARIPRMEARSDVPFMPPEFRDVLVHYVCRDLSILADNDRMATYHDRRLNEYLRLMRRRGLVSDAQRHIRRSMFSRPGQRPIPLVQPPVLLG